MSAQTLSVLVPCYNALPFVLEAVESILEQADDAVECIVVDDGSTDGSADALEEKFGSRIRLVRQANAGVAAARNRALDLARGDLIAWFDADDILAPGSLEFRRRLFAEDPELEMLVGQVEIFDADTGQREVSPQPPCDRHYLVTGLLARRNLPHMDALTFRRGALEKVGRFDSSYGVGEELPIWLRAFGRLRWCFRPEVLAFQRQGSHDSITHRLGKIGHYREQQLMLRKIRAISRELLGSDRPWKQAYAAYAADFALVLLTRGYRARAVVWAARSQWGGGMDIRLRGLKYALEAASPGAYAISRRAYGWLGLR